MQRSEIRNSGLPLQAPQAGPTALSRRQALATIAGVAGAAISQRVEPLVAVKIGEA